MMAFNHFNAAQLLAPQQPTTPLKAEDAAGEALRYLSNGGLLPGAPFSLAMPPNLDALRAMGPAGLPMPLMYPLPQDLKPEMLGGIGPFPPVMLDHGALGFHPYGYDMGRRKNATRETTAPLKAWLNEHRKNPYPTKAEKLMLSMLTKMSMTQVSTWFANARRRLKKENGGAKWSPTDRREGDDDDDLADIDADRPSSSTSNISDNKEDLDITVNSENGKETTSTTATETPKKKIWSIADTIDSLPDKEASTSKKESPSSEESPPQHLSALHQQMAAVYARMQFNPQVLAAIQASMQASGGRTPMMPFYGFPPMLPSAIAPTSASISPSQSPVAEDKKKSEGKVETESA